MYRFLIVNKTGCLALPVTNKERNLSRQICSICHKLHNIHKGLNYSTNRDPAEEKRSRKRGAKETKSYAEIIVVGKGSTAEEKAPVHRLSLKDLKLFTKTNLSLAELFKLKSVHKKEIIREHTYHNLTIIDHLPVNNLRDLEVSLKVPSKPDPEHVENAKPLDSECKPLESLVCNSYESAGIEEDDVTHTLQNHPIQTQTATAEVIARTLLPYLEICNYLKAPQRGLNTLIFHRHHVGEVYPPIKDVRVYNYIMSGFAAKGNYNKIEEILNYATEDSIRINVQTYAAIFECLGRINVADSHLKQIRVHASNAYQLKISFDRILNETQFMNDQREMVLKAIQSHSPNYQFKLRPLYLQYSNDLVNALNHSEQLKPPPDRPCKGDGLFTNQDLLANVKKQLELEKQSYVTVKSIEMKEDIASETFTYRAIFNDVIKHWEKAAINGFNRDLLALTARRNILTLEPYLRLMPAKEYAQIIIEEVKRLAQGCEKYSLTTKQLYRLLGMKVYGRYRVLHKQKTGVIDKIIKVHGEYCEHYVQRYSNQEVSYHNSRQLWQWIEHANKLEGASAVITERHWTPNVLQDIGKFMYNIIMRDLKIDVNAMRLDTTHKNFLPCFYTIFRTRMYIITEEIKPHPILLRLYRASMPETLTFSINELPMLCPPVPWTSIKNGGYLVAPTSLVRLAPAAFLQKQRMEDASSSQLYPSLDSLNQLSAVPWKVNTPILDIVVEVFNSGGSSKLNIPELYTFSKPPTGDKKERLIHTLQIKKKQAEIYSLWCDCLYRLSLANHFRNDVFWLPHNMDFRGRVYPIPPHLNHLGADMARSLLMFAEPRPLGPNGFDNLKLHLVNLTGSKKRANITDRLIYANEVMDKVLDSADYPLTGKMWWAKSENPWQTLACCMEIAKAHRSDDPEKYLCNFPIHQDGSCNGLQHYAALGRDQAGAYSVNLTPSHIPQDVYSTVVAMVEQQRAKDEEAGNEVAKSLKGVIARRVIKQTIMTTVYGVTRYGAQLQIEKQLKDANFSKEHLWAAATYLTNRTFESLRSMFQSTREIQNWFTDCAGQISSVCLENVEWVTPLGLPVVQPYNKRKALGSRLLYQSFPIDKYEKPDARKQRNAFPPNFIHSLDSSHMMLTSLWCERRGIVFVSVHDCYWTHPCTVAAMNEICREQFVELHSQNILGDLSQFLMDKFSYKAKKRSDGSTPNDVDQLKVNRVLSSVPKTGDFNIKEVMQSVYFFS